MRNLKENLELLYSFKLLEKGWNGYDADPIDIQVIERAIAIVSKLEKQPEIFPTANDSVQLEYSTEKGYLEFEIFRDHINSFKKTNEGKESIGNLTEREMTEEINVFLTNK